MGAQILNSSIITKKKEDLLRIVEIKTIGVK